MATVTVRPSASKECTLCWQCHWQLLEALSEKEFRADRRYGEDEGFWRVPIAVGKCVGCEACVDVGTWVGEKILALCGTRHSKVFDICLTAQQMAEATTCAPVGAVTGAKEPTHNGNVQLCNMRANSITKGDIGRDTLYKQAVFEVWPYLTTLMTSSDANHVPVEDRGVTCCGGRQSTIRCREYVYVKRRRRVCDEPPVDPSGPTADEQIHGGTMPGSGPGGDLPNVKYVADAHHEGVVEHADVLAVKFAPTTADRKFYANTPENIKQAVKGRITDVYQPFELTSTERDELTAITDSLCDDIRKSDSIERIASWLLFGNIKSTKWTLSRAEMALNVLMWRLNPEYEFKAAIKLEPMPNGKDPRMLIADGDSGAVMSALSVGVLERYYCKYHKHRTIKGKPKADRMAEICKEAFERQHSGEAYEAFMMENDGSAWDACCRSILRDLTENKIIAAVVDKLWHFFVPYNWFQPARKAADTKKQFKVAVATNKVSVVQYTKSMQYTQDDLAKVICKKAVHIRFDAIRRSGDRGTSILNFIINLICWSWVLCGPEGPKMAAPNTKVVVDVFGSRRRLKIWLEGDDSLLWLTGALFSQAQIDFLTDRWKKLGHRPKLFLRTVGDVAEFCGWKIYVTKYGLDETTATPDVPRMLKNLGYSTAKEAVQAAQRNDVEGFGRVVAPALVARAGSIAPRCPTVARWLMNLAYGMCKEYQLTDAQFSRDDMFRLGADDMNELLPEWWKDDDPAKLCACKYESFLGKVSTDISNAVASGQITVEADLAIKHGWVNTAKEWFEFAHALNMVNTGTPDELFRSIVPPGMM